MKSHHLMIALALVLTNARAEATIVNAGSCSLGCVGRQIQYFSPIGQTFTADSASLDSFSFWIGDANAVIAPLDFSIDIAIYDGVGTAGPVVTTSSFGALSDDYDGWADFFFGGVPLVIGHPYTAIVSNETPRWFVYGGSDEYFGGTAILNDGVGVTSDLWFRVNAAESPVPEPSSLLLIGTGLAFGAVRQGRKRRAGPTSYRCQPSRYSRRT